MVLCELCTKTWLVELLEDAHKCPSCFWSTSAWEFYTEDFPELEFPEKN